MFCFPSKTYLLPSLIYSTSLCVLLIDLILRNICIQLIFPILSCAWKTHISNLSFSIKYFSSNILAQRGICHWHLNNYNMFSALTALSSQYPDSSPSWSALWKPSHPLIKLQWNCWSHDSQSWTSNVPVALVVISASTHSWILSSIM